MKYITLDEGIDFRKIAKIMTDAGYTMNHATARNVLFVSLKNLFTNISNELGIKLTEEKIEEMLKSQQLHDALSDVLHRVHYEGNEK